MKRKFVSMLGLGCFLLAGNGLAAMAHAAASSSESCPITTGPKDIKPVLENSANNPMPPAPGETALQSMLRKLQIAGGISGGTFYASNPGQDTSGNQALLSNFLVELSTKDNDLPIAFEAAMGETSTPSLLGTPDGTSDLDLEYASLSFNALPNTSVKAGLLKPDAGFEDSYTYNNPM